MGRRFKNEGEGVEEKRKRMDKEIRKLDRDPVAEARRRTNMARQRKKSSLHTIMLVLFFVVGFGFLAIVFIKGKQNGSITIGSNLKERLAHKDQYIHRLSMGMVDGLKKINSWDSRTKRNQEETIASFREAATNEYEFLMRASNKIKSNAGLESFADWIHKKYLTGEVRQGDYKTEAQIEALVKRWEYDELQDRNR